MRCYIVLVSNGPSVLITELDTDGTVENLIRRGFKNFNLYHVSQNNIEIIRSEVGDREWDLVASELNLEWPVRVIERDNAKSFGLLQQFANAMPSAIVKKGKNLLNFE